MNTVDKKCDMSIIFNEVDRLSTEPEFIMTDSDMLEYDEIRVLGQILQETQPPQLMYYTGD